MGQPLRIKGWYASREDKEALECLKRYSIPSSFVYTIRAFDSDDIVVSDIERIVGTWLNPTEVIAIFTPKGSSVPFFVAKPQADQLRNLASSTDVMV